MHFSILFCGISGQGDVSLTLTSFVKEMSAAKIYQDVPVHVGFDIVFNNQGSEYLMASV